MCRGEEPSGWRDCHRACDPVSSARTDVGASALQRSYVSRGNSRGKQVNRCAAFSLSIGHFDVFCMFVFGFFVSCTSDDFRRSKMMKDQNTL